LFLKIAAPCEKERARQAGSAMALLFLVNLVPSFRRNNEQKDEMGDTKAIERLENPD